MDTILLMGVPLRVALSNAPRGCTCVRSATRRITAWSTAEPTDFQLDGGGENVVSRLFHASGSFSPEAWCPQAGVAC